MGVLQSFGGRPFSLGEGRWACRPSVDWIRPVEGAVLRERGMIGALEWIGACGMGWLRCAPDGKGDPALAPLVGRDRLGFVLLALNTCFCLACKIA